MRLEAISIGPSARRTLRTPCRATVIALFDRSFYLDARGDLIAVCAQGLFDGPLNLVVARPAHVPRWRDLGVLVGQRWFSTGDRLLPMTGLLIDLGTAARWRPRPGEPVVDRRQLEQGLCILLKRAVLRHADQGLSRLALWPRARPVGATERAAFPLLRAVRRDLASWRLEARSTLPKGLFGLIGLGPGLTPSGDDLIAGMLIAWHRLGDRAAATRLAGQVRAAARQRTSPISLAFLEAAGEGFGSAPLHDLLEALIDGSAGEITAALDRISTIGQVSGWDAVGGIVLALDAWLAAESSRSAAA